VRKIILTGGGTAGHVTPNLALIPELKKSGFDIYYIGTSTGIERKLVDGMGIEYFPISAGKLRRYFDLENLTDIGRVLKGFCQSIKIIRKVKPDVVFSKGGFVSVTVVWAARLLGVPVVIHESDIAPGLANRLSMPFADRICYSFPETEKYLDRYVKNNKARHTGIPIRSELFSGDANTGRRICGFGEERPVLLVMGGSQGSRFINNAVRSVLRELLLVFQVCHVCGRGGVDNALLGLKGYKQIEYAAEELPHLFAMADVVVSRSGATTLFELLALRKPSLLIPLSRRASRGDQIENAESFKGKGFSYVLSEEDVNPSSFVRAVIDLYNERKAIIGRMRASSMGDGTERVVKVILDLLVKR